MTATVTARTAPRNTGARFEEEMKLWKWLGNELLGNAFNTTAITDFEELKKAVKRALFADAERLVDVTGQNTPPVNPEIVAKARKVIEIESAAIDTDALIVPCRGGFLMKINEKLPLVRQRFACAHEIAHTYFFDLGTDPPSKPYKRSAARYWVEEGLCYELARRILMPTEMIKRWMDNATPPYIRDFRAMMRSFFVSGELLAYRIHDLAPWNALMLIFELNNRTDTGSGDRDRDIRISLYKVLKSGNKLNNIHVGRKGLEVTDPVLKELLLCAFRAKNTTEVVEESGIRISIGNLRGEIASLGASYMGSYPPKVIAILSL